MSLALGKTHSLDCVEGMRRLDAGSVDLVIADPPFNLGNGGRMFHRGRLERRGDMGWDHVENAPWLGEAMRVLRPTGTLLIFGTYHNAFEIGFRLQQAGARILNTIVLCKSNGFSVSHRLLYERTTFVIWASPSGQDWHFDYALGKRTNGGRQADNVWRYAPPVHRMHPTQKPLAIVERLILLTTRPGELVLDPFMGSGTTAEACVRQDRRFLGFENLPAFAEAANARVRGLDWARAFARVTAAASEEPFMSVPNATVDLGQGR